MTEANDSFEILIDLMGVKEVDLIVAEVLLPKENFTLDPFLLSMGQDINSFEGDEETIENERNEVLSHEDTYMDGNGDDTYSDDFELGQEVDLIYDNDSDSYDDDNIDSDFHDDDSIAEIEDNMKPLASSTPSSDEK